MRDQANISVVKLAQRLGASERVCLYEFEMS